MKTLRRLTLLCVLFFSATIGSVCAIWQFTNGRVPAISTKFDFSMTDWLFDSGEILPGNINIGQSHQDLLSGVLGKNPNTNKNHSLNGKDAIEKAVKNKGTLYWFENVQGSNLKHVFTTTASEELEFVMKYISETGEIYLYTYTSEDLYQAPLNNTPIQVYLTVLVNENGVWNDLGSLEGHSVVSMHPTAYDKRIINPDNFQAGAKP